LKELEKPIILIKFLVQNDFKPLPIQVKIQKMEIEKQIKFKIQYKINPKVKLDSLVFVLNPLLETKLKIINVDSKPEGKLSNSKEKVLWKIEDFNMEANSLLSIFYYNENIESDGTLKYGFCSVNFKDTNNSFIGLDIPGANGLENSENEFFLGGMENSFESGKFEILI
jgi:hypothetical protein